jgi:hypothetical protein
MIKQGQILKACNEITGTKIIENPNNPQHDSIEKVILFPQDLIFVDECNLLEDTEYNQFHYSIKATVGGVRDVYFVSDVASNDFEVLQEIGE